jgi:hypothetical protein
VWAGLLALADQARAQAGAAPLNSGSPTEAQQALYNLPTGDFHDVVSGSNGYAAGAGYDLATGLGTPVANLLVPDLATYGGAVNTSRSITVTPATLASFGGGSGGSGSGPMNAVAVHDAVVVSALADVSRPSAAPARLAVPADPAAGPPSGPSAPAANAHPAEKAAAGIVLGVLAGHSGPVHEWAAAVRSDGLLATILAGTGLRADGRADSLPGDGNLLPGGLSRVSAETDVPTRALEQLTAGWRLRLDGLEELSTLLGQDAGADNGQAEEAVDIFLQSLGEQPLLEGLADGGE